MRVRFSLLGLLLIVGVVGVALGLVVTFARSQQRQQLEVERQRVMAELAQAQAIRFATFAEQMRAHAEADKIAKAHGEDSADPAQGRQSGELERLRGENAGLRARVRELERALKAHDAPRELPTELVP